MKKPFAAEEEESHARHAGREDKLNHKRKTEKPYPAPEMASFSFAPRSCQLFYDRQDVLSLPPFIVHGVHALFHHEDPEPPDLPLVGG